MRTLGSTLAGLALTGVTLFGALVVGVELIGTDMPVDLHVLPTDTVQR